MNDSPVWRPAIVWVHPDDVTVSDWPEVDTTVAYTGDARVVNGAVEIVEAWRRGRGYTELLGHATPGNNLGHVSVPLHRVYLIQWCSVAEYDTRPVA